MEKFIEDVREVNDEGSYYLRNFQLKTRKAMTEKPALVLVVLPMSSYSTRNTTESFDLVFSGLEWQPGDSCFV